MDQLIGQMNIFDFIPDTEEHERIKQLSRFKITEADVYAAVKSGSGFEDSKFRILDAYNTNHLNEFFLKNEYGLGGGKSFYFIDGGSGFMEHDSKGISIRHFKANESRNVGWKEMINILKWLISSGQYLNQKEQKEYEEWGK